MPRARLVIILIVGALLAAGLWVWLSAGQTPAQYWQGYAEADFVKIGPTQPGLLTQVVVRRGDQVKAGDFLFAQDDIPDREARDQAVNQLAQAREQAANLKAASKPTEIQQAEANLADARATLVRTQGDLQRAEGLIQSGAITRQTLDQRKSDYASALAHTAAMQAALRQAQNPMGRDREIRAQKAAVAAARSALDIAQWRLSQRRVESPAGGRIADVLARPGETLAAGQPVISLLPPGNIFIRFFVPEADLSKISLGERLGFRCDGCRPGLEATVSFISPQAEFTPPLIYSEENRSKLVFMIEARPDPAEAVLLNPGQPVEVAKSGRSESPGR